MGKRSSRQLDFVIDKLTNSIENAVTGEVFDTDIVRLTAKDVKLVGAKQLKGQRMYLDNIAADKLISKYFK